MAIIDKPSDYFNTKLYTGTGSELVITGVGFQPDWTWIKGRNVAYDHNLFDAVRGATKTIKSNKTDAESTQAQMLKSFDSDGFTIGTDGAVNENDTRTYVAWNWLANGAGSANTDGSINSTVSANTTSGFSIVSYTGTGSNATVGHGLGVVPNMIIVKSRSVGDGWRIYHDKVSSDPETDYLVLNNTNAVADSNGYWNDTAPTSSVFSLGTAGEINGSGNSHIAYCFAEKQGYSKFGSYTGNGNADGSFIYTGFKPAWTLIKRTDGADDWFLLDNKRDIDNPANHWLMADSSSAEQTSPIFFDFLSNGFKNRGTGGGNNASGGSYIYMAFAENPFVASNFVPATAR